MVDETQDLSSEDKAALAENSIGGGPGGSHIPKKQPSFSDRFPNLKKPKSENPINQLNNLRFPENKTITLEESLIFAKEKYGIEGVVKLAKLLFDKPPTAEQTSALVISLHDKGDRMGRGQFTHLHRARDISKKISEYLYQETCDNIVENPKDYLSEEEVRKFKKGDFRKNVLSAIKDINYTFERKEELLEQNNEVKKPKENEKKNLFFYTAEDGYEAELCALLHDTVEDGYLSREHLEELGYPKNVIDIVCHVDKYEYLPHKIENSEVDNKTGKRLFHIEEGDRAQILEDYNKYFIGKNPLYKKHGAGSYSKENIDFDEVERYLGGYFKPLIKRAEEGFQEKKIEKFSPNKMIKLLQTKMGDFLDNSSAARNDLTYSDAPSNHLSKNKKDGLSLESEQVARAKKSRTNIVKYDIGKGLLDDFFKERFGIDIRAKNISVSNISVPSR